jgi:hypothetical protein
MGITIKKREYDPSKDGNLEFIGLVESSGRNRRDARKNLELKVSKMGATHIFGPTYNKTYSYMVVQGSAYTSG